MVKSWQLSPWHVLLVAVLLCGAMFAHASTADVEQWLARMQQASVEQNYRGTFVLTRGKMSSSMRVVHAYENGVESERLMQLDGEMGEIIRRNGQVMCIFPDNRVVQLEKDRFANQVVKAFADFMPDSRYYALAVSGDERLINRQVVRVEVKARDQHRYSYVLWLDKQTGLLLKSSLRNAAGEELEHFRFTDIEFPARIQPEELQPMTQGAVVAHEFIPPVPQDQRWPDAMMWNVGYQPPGFAAVMAPKRPGVNAMLYSDGLASYSIFVERVNPDMMPEGASMVGATVAYADKLEAEGHHYAVTVIGQIPPMTAMKVAESVRPSMQGGS